MNPQVNAFSTLSASAARFKAADSTQSSVKPSASQPLDLSPPPTPSWTDVPMREVYQQDQLQGGYLQYSVDARMAKFVNGTPLKGEQRTDLEWAAIDKGITPESTAGQAHSRLGLERLKQFGFAGLGAAMQIAGAALIGGSIYNAFNALSSGGLTVSSATVAATLVVGGLVGGLLSFAVGDLTYDSSRRSASLAGYQMDKVEDLARNTQGARLPYTRY